MSLPCASTSTRAAVRAAAGAAGLGAAKGKGRARISSTAASQAASTPSPSSSSSSQLIRPVRIVPPRPSAAAAPPKKSRAMAKQPVKPKEVAPDPRSVELSRIYALVSPPSRTAIAALADRISPNLLGSRSGKDLVALLEQCCTCPTFWKVVAEHERQQDAGTRAATTYTNFLDQSRAHNESLSVLGNHVLGMFALEWLEARYPHLPSRVIKAALTLFVGPRTCADIASKSWGITSGQASRAAFLPDLSPNSHKAGQPLRGAGEGNRAGSGLLRWGRTEEEQLDRFLDNKESEVALQEMKAAGKDGRTQPLPLEEALASVSRAVVGLIFQEHGFAATRVFVHSVFLSRQADIAGLLKFTNPKYALSSALSKYDRPAPVSRLVGETGRLSIAPIFVTGVYSGAIKLGEGFGSSIKMSEYRANEDALRRIYLSPLVEDPVSSSSASASSPTPSLSQQQQQIELPSDTLVYPGRRLNRMRKLADEEILWQSSGKSSIGGGSSPRAQ